MFKESLNLCKMEILCQQDFRESIDTDFFNIRSDFYSTTVTDDGIVIDDKTFRHNNLNHMKRTHTLLDVNGIFKTSEKKELLIECEISARQFFRNSELIPKIPSQYINRINNIHEDPRLCCTGFYAFEDETNMSYMFLITNGMIYALYGREMELVRAEDDYSERDPTYKVSSGCFYSLIPLFKRGFDTLTPKDGPLSEFITLSLGFTKDKVTWYRNKEPIFNISNIGYRNLDQHTVVEHGGFNIQSENNNFRVGFGHFSFLDFQLPNNYSRQMTSTEIFGGCRIERSCSGLAQLYPTEYYKEPYPNTLGKYVNIVPEKSFAIGYEEAMINSNYLLFGQGMVTIIKTIFVGLRSNKETKTPDFEPGINGDAFNRKKVPKRIIEKKIGNKKYTKPRVVPVGKKFDKKSPEETSSDETSSDETSSDDNSTIPCPVQRNSIRSKVSIESLSSTETIDCDQPKRNQMTRNPMNRNIGFDRDAIKKVNINQSSTNSSEFIDDHQSNSQSNSQSYEESDSGFVSMDKLRRKSNKIEIEDFDSLETVDSLESAGVSLAPKSHDKCWICNKKCQGMCCSGNCGSISCKKTRTTKPAIVKGISSRTNKGDNLNNPGKPLKFAYHSSRFN